MPGLIVRALLLIGLLSAPARVFADENDVIFVIDNSAGMREHDSSYRVPQAIIDSIYRLDGHIRVGIVLFDAEPTLAVPLTPVTPANRAMLMAGTDQVRYTGRRTNPAAAVERAIYHLRFDSRAGAGKWIVLVSDGRVEIGNRRRNRDLQKWLEQDLAQAAVDERIRLIGMAFARADDHRVLQQLAVRTNGEFLPVFSSGDIERGFEHAIELIRTSPPISAEGGVAESTEGGGEPAGPPALGSADAPKPVERADPPAPDGATSLLRRPWVWVWGGIAVLGVMIVIGFLAFRVRRYAPITASGPTRKALLIDRTGVSGQHRYEIEGQAVIIGRKAVDPRHGAQSVVINRRTISRRHAAITFHHYSYWIADQGTKNGTYVNGQRIVEQTKLGHGDVVKVDDFEFEFRLPDAEEEDCTIYAEEDVDATVYKSDEVEIACPPDENAAADASGGTRA